MQSCHISSVFCFFFWRNLTPPPQINKIVQVGIPIVMDHFQCIVEKKHLILIYFENHLHTSHITGPPSWFEHAHGKRKHLGQRTALGASQTCIAQNNVLKRGVLCCRVAAGVSARQCHVVAWFCDHSDHSDHSVTILHDAARTVEYYAPVGWNLYCPSHPCPQALTGVSWNSTTLHIATTS